MAGSCGAIQGSSHARRKPAIGNFPDRFHLDQAAEAMLILS
jgi:hypothetical protein